MGDSTGSVSERDPVVEAGAGAASADPPALLRLRGGGRRLPAPGTDRTPEGADRSHGRDEPARGGRWIWRRLDLDLTAGELLAVAGATGAGKSLLLRALAGLDPLDEGEVRLLDRPLSDWEIPRYRATAVYLHQSPPLGPGTVESVLREPFGFGVHRGRGWERQRALDLLAPVGRGPAFLDQSVEELSGGERQIVALVRAMSVAPRVLLLDEPTAALDPDATRRTEELVRGWLADDAAESRDAATDPPGRAALWVTHDAGQAGRIADRRLRLVGGRLEPDGTRSPPAAAGPGGA